MSAATVDKAIALIDAQIFDVAMLDMNLNGDKTYSVADALAARVCRSCSRPATAVST